MKTLNERRLDAAKGTKGISGSPIRNLVLRIIEDIPTPPEAILDFGAGVGDFIKILDGAAIGETLKGIDILERPEQLPDNIDWVSQDLNEEFSDGTQYDLVVSLEVIEHLENPRAMIRNIFSLLKPGGHAIITTPNQNSLSSILALIFKGHFIAFLDSNYPGHITALTNLDLIRIAKEAGFTVTGIEYTDSGRPPKFRKISWQALSFGILKGKWFSGNVAILLQKPSKP